MINHSPDAILVTQYAANFFVNQARQSAAAFPSLSAETAALIWNYQPIFTGLYDSDFEQCYIWTLTNA